MNQPSLSKCAWIIRSSSPSSTGRAARVCCSAALRMRVRLPRQHREAGLTPAASVSDKFLVELRIVAAASEKLVMRPPLNNFSALEHQNLMRVADRGKPMGDDEAGPALKKLLQRALDDGLGVRVNGARRFIEDQNARPGDHRANEAEELPFAGRSEERRVGKECR